MKTLFSYLHTQKMQKKVIFCALLRKPNLNHKVLGFQENPEISIHYFECVCAPLLQFLPVIRSQYLGYI